MSRPNLSHVGQLDKNTERSSYNFPFQLEKAVRDYARSKGLSKNQALKWLVARGLHSEHFDITEWFTEPLTGD